MAGGRPRNETTTRRDCVVSVRLTEAERAGLEARAIDAALPVADFARVALAQAEPPRRRRASTSAAPIFAPAELAALDRIGGDLRAIGNNVNQLARALNYGTGRPIEADLRAALADLATTRGALDTLFARFLPC